MPIKKAVTSEVVSHLSVTKVMWNFVRIVKFNNNTVGPIYVYNSPYKLCGATRFSFILGLWGLLPKVISVLLNLTKITYETFQFFAVLLAI
jgi:hypothetical protein